MPQAWRIRTPSSVSKLYCRACGTAEPPHRTTRSEDRSPPSARMWPSTPAQIVGTPPATVTFSSPMSRTSVAG